jgi:hypothetical protein
MQAVSRARYVSLACPRRASSNPTIHFGHGSRSQPSDAPAIPSTVDMRHIDGPTLIASSGPGRAALHSGSGKQTALVHEPAVILQHATNRTKGILKMITIPEDVPDPSVPVGGKLVDNGFHLRHQRLAWDRPRRLRCFSNTRLKSGFRDILYRTNPAFRHAKACDQSSDVPD